MNIFEAIYQNNHEKVLSLLANGVPVNSVEDASMLTPLHHAVSRNDLLMTFILLSVGADLCAKDVFGLSAADIAIEHQHATVYKLLLRFAGIKIVIK